MMHQFISSSYFLTGVGMGIFIPLFITLLVAVLVLKGYSLWYSARAGQKWWFLAILVINTLGILEIVYLIFFNPQKHTEKNTLPADTDTQHDSSSPVA